MTGDGSGIGRWRRDFSACLIFFTRLPVSMPGDDFPPYPRAFRATPLAGAVVGLVAALVLAVLEWLDVPSAVTAAIVLAVLAVMTGALHEDGLGDVADGFGGGSDRARKLAIMKDSRTGSYGVVAIGLSLLVRFAALDQLIAAYGVAAGSVVIAAAAASRGFAMALTRLPSARPDGTASALGGIDTGPLLQAVALSVLIAAIATIGVVGVAGVTLGLVVSAIAIYLVARLAMAQIGGHTGDVVGAGQQAAEIAFLVTLTVLA